MFEPLPTPRQMATWDKSSIEDIGILPEVLMENASREVLATMHENGMVTPGKRIAVFCGPGNNGGDGFALARHLATEGCDVELLHTKPLNEYSGETAYNIQLASKLNIRMKEIGPDNASQAALICSEFAPDCIVDALLGTGITGQLKPGMEALITTLNSFRNNTGIVSIDIPSGLNGISGKPSPVAIHADLTVTFEAAKLGLVQPEAKAFIGELVVRRIGIPQYVKLSHPASHFLLNSKIAAFLPESVPASHKGSYGSVLIVGGSLGMPGAPMLSAYGALRSGAGLVCIACPGKIHTDVYAGVPDVLVLPAGSQSQWDLTALDSILKSLDRFQSVVIGPGMGRNKEVLGFLSELLKNLSVPTVIDADALFALSQADNTDFLKQNAHQTIITPHPKEAALLLGKEIAEVQADRPGACRELVDKFGCICVLKGAASVIGAPDTPLFVSPFDEPNLSIAGSGDVLAGLVASLAAQQQKSAFNGTLLGVYWHGMAGKILRTQFPCRGNLSSEIATILPHARKEILHAYS